MLRPDSTFLMYRIQQCPHSIHKKTAQEAPYYTRKFSGNSPVASRNRLLHSAVPQAAISPYRGPHGGLFAPSRRVAGAYSCALATPNFAEFVLSELPRSPRMRTSPYWSSAMLGEKTHHSSSQTHFP